MRKRTIKNLFDNIFWYAVYLLPVFYIVFAWYNGQTLNSFNSLFLLIDEFGYSFGFTVFDTNPVYICLSSLFGFDGIFPMFDSPALLYLVIYFINCWILHLAVDALLFIVRWAHNMMDGFLGGKHD